MTANDDDYGVTYAVYDRDRIPQLMRSPGPVSGGTQREMTMTRIPDDLARDLVEWAADEGNMLHDDGYVVMCLPCLGWKVWYSKREISHQDDCIHERAKRALAARAPDEAGPGMRAVEVAYRYDGKLTHAGEGDDD